MQLKDLRFALNAIQWINVKEDPSDPDSANLWRYADPTFVAEYPDVMREIRETGFDAIMMEVLDTQTLQDYAGMIREAGLAVAPGYVQVPLPSDTVGRLERGTNEWIHWFDAVRRKAEESNYMGLDTIFLAPEMSFAPNAVRTVERPAVGADFSQDRLDEVVEMVTAAAEVLQREGVHPGLHNHVGTWVETEYEVDYVLRNVDPAVLGASFDLGHLEWAGVDSKTMIERWSDRLVDLHIKDLDVAIARDSRENPRPYHVTTDQGIFLEPGLGQLDLVGALETLPESFDGWVIIEVDRASMDPVESAKTTARWLAQVTA